jgi:hypothetical protein
MIYQPFPVIATLCVSSIVSFHSQVAALKVNGWLDPPDQGPGEYYFPLREGAIDSATRAVIWSGESAKDLVIFQLNFTAVGVDTLMSDVLWVRPGGHFTGASPVRTVSLCKQCQRSSFRLCRHSVTLPFPA